MAAGSPRTASSAGAGGNHREARRCNRAKRDRWRGTAGFGVVVGQNSIRRLINHEYAIGTADGCPSSTCAGMQPPDKVTVVRCRDPSRECWIAPRPFSSPGDRGRAYQPGSQNGPVGARYVPPAARTSARAPRTRCAWLAWRADGLFGRHSQQSSHPSPISGRLTRTSAFAFKGKNIDV
jgi:hypothetical protein